MKELILIRHAKSSWKDSSLKDFDRPLNKRGEKNAPKMAKILRKLVKTPDLIISSPSKRTKQTLNYFVDEFNYKNKIIFEDSIYEAPYSNILKIIQNINKKYNIVFLICHNPGLNDLVDFLLENFDENIPTIGLVKINFNVNSWDKIEKNSGNLEFFKYPKMLDI